MSALQPDGSVSPFQPSTLALIIAIALMSFGALATLLAWGPELQSRDRAGAHAYSSSALGYAGLIKVLELNGRSVTVSRTQVALENHTGLVILAPEQMTEKLEDYLPFSGPVLILLPKWEGEANALKSQWHKTTVLRAERDANAILKTFDPEAEIKRIAPEARVSLGQNRFSLSPDEKLQLISSEEFEAVLDVNGGALLARLPDSDIYFLSDPDVANNFGLARPEHARFLLSILNLIDDREKIPVLFDATLNGFEETTNLLRILIDVPFFGATLILLSGFLLLGWAACARFGAPDPEALSFALGKQALADNTAGLIAMTEREPSMAPGYLSLSRKAAAKALGAPLTMSSEDLDTLLDRLGPETSSGQTWTQISADMRAPAKSRDDLLNKARHLYRWRKEKTNGHS